MTSLRLIENPVLSYHLIEWVQYYNDDQPSIDGIFVGDNVNGDAVYVGLIDHDGRAAPGQLILSGPRKGFYLGYAGRLIKRTSGIKYFKKESGCDYKWIQSSRGERISNAVFSSNNRFTFYVGRIFSGGVYHAGRVALHHNDIRYAFNGKESRSKTDYEVLICDKTETTPATPTVSFKQFEDMEAELKELKMENQNLANNLSTATANLLRKIEENEELAKRCADGTTTTSSTMLELYELLLVDLKELKLESKNLKKENADLNTNLKAKMQELSDLQSICSNSQF